MIMMGKSFCQIWVKFIAKQASFSLQCCISICEWPYKKTASSVYCSNITIHLHIKTLCSTSTCVCVYVSGTKYCSVSMFFGRICFASRNTIWIIKLYSTLSTFSTNLPQFWGSQIPLIFVLSQQLLLQFKSTYKTGSITATLLLLTSLIYYHVVTYKQSTVDYQFKVATYRWTHDYTRCSHERYTKW